MFYGHERQYQRLAATVGGGRSPHGWLLRGRSGIGKATLAYRLTRQLLAFDGEGDPQDPTSRVFRMVAENGHPDLHVLTPLETKKGRRGEIKVEEVRNAVDKLHRTAAFDGWRVLLIDAADDLNRNAANALLKLLEEPPRRTILLLVCQQVGRLPRTIVSRCAQLRLAPLSESQVATGLRELAPELDAPKIGRLAAVAGGSLGQALRYATLDWDTRCARLLDQLDRPTAAARLACLDELTAVSDQADFATAAELLLAVTRQAALSRAGLDIAGAAGLADRAELAQWASLWKKLRSFAAKVDGLNLDPAQSLLTMIHAVSGQDTIGLDHA